MNLDVGCGKNPIHDCVTVDLFGGIADITAPMWEIPLKSGTVDTLYCRYALEHLPLERVLPTLHEFGRLIKADGEIVITVPDLAWCCQHFVDYPDTGQSLHNLFGGQSGPGDFHRTGFTEKILRDDCRTVGLVVVAVERTMDHYFENMIFHVRKTGEWAEMKKTEKEKDAEARKEWRK